MQYFQVFKPFRGQTVNLLSLTSVVRIHLPPPKYKNPVISIVTGFFLLYFALSGNDETV